MNKVICKYIKLSPSGPVFAQLVEHRKGLTFVSSEPEEDKDFNLNGVPQAEKYIVNLGYKKVNDKTIKTEDDRPCKWAIYYPAKFGGTREYYSNKDAAFKRAIHVAKRDNWTEEMKAGIKIEEYGVEGSLLKTYSYKEYNKFVSDSKSINDFSNIKDANLTPNTWAVRSSFEKSHWYSTYEGAVDMAKRLIKRNKLDENGLSKLITIDEFDNGKFIRTIRYNEFMKDSVNDKLIQSGSKKALKKNIATEIKAGKDPKQAAAIAYSVQKKNDQYPIENKFSKTTGISEPITKGLKDGIQLTKEPGTDKITYVMQSNIDKNLYFYIGKIYSMKEGTWTYAKYKMNGVSPESLVDELKKNGWHQINKGPANIIDSKVKDYGTKSVFRGLLFTVNNKVDNLGQFREFGVDGIYKLSDNEYVYIKNYKNSPVNHSDMQRELEKKYACIDIVGFTLDTLPNGKLDDWDMQRLGKYNKYSTLFMKAANKYFRVNDSGEDMKRFNVTYKDRGYNVIAKDHGEAIKKVLKYNKDEEKVVVNDERLSPMTYKKLKEMGYGPDDWKGLNQEEADKNKN